MLLGLAQKPNHRLLARPQELVACWSQREDDEATNSSCSVTPHRRVGVIIALAVTAGCGGGSPDAGAVHSASLAARAAATVFDDLGRSDLISLPTGRRQFHDAASRALDAANAAHVGWATREAHGLSLDAARVTQRFSTAVDDLFAAREALLMAGDVLKEAQAEAAALERRARLRIEVARDRALGDSRGQHEASLKEIRDARAAAVSEADALREERVQEFFDTFYGKSDEERRKIDFDAALDEINEQHQEKLRSIDAAHGQRTATVHRQRSGGVNAAMERAATSDGAENVEAAAAIRAALDDVAAQTEVASQRTQLADRLRLDAKVAYAAAAAAWEAATLTRE